MKQTELVNQLKYGHNDDLQKKCKLNESVMTTC